MFNHIARSMLPLCVFPSASASACSGESPEMVGDEPIMEGDTLGNSGNGKICSTNFS